VDEFELVACTCVYRASEWYGTAEIDDWSLSTTDDDAVQCIWYMVSMVARTGYGDAIEGEIVTVQPCPAGLPVVNM